IDCNPRCDPDHGQPSGICCVVFVVVFVVFVVVFCVFPDNCREKHIAPFSDPWAPKVVVPKVVVVVVVVEHSNGSGQIVVVVVVLGLICFQAAPSCDCDCLVSVRAVFFEFLVGFFLSFARMIYSGRA
ncbi:unnamed protein product, partial [Polarella glacialis]